MKVFIILSLVIASTVAFQESDVVSGRIESCRGCSLNRLPEVKQFIMSDAPNYDKLEVKFISGAPPELILLGKNDNELERIALSELNRQQCNELIQSKGFAKKATANTEF